MKDREQILTLPALCKPELESRFRVESQALSGSCARGDQAPGSDADILVEVGPEIGLDFATPARESLSHGLPD